MPRGLQDQAPISNASQVLQHLKRLLDCLFTRPDIKEETGKQTPWSTTKLRSSFNFYSKAVTTGSGPLMVCEKQSLTGIRWAYPLLQQNPAKRCKKYIDRWIRTGSFPHWTASSLNFSRLQLKILALEGFTSLHISIDSPGPQLCDAKQPSLALGLTIVRVTSQCQND